MMVSWYVESEAIAMMFSLKVAKWKPRNSKGSQQSLMLSWFAVDCDVDFMTQPLSRSKRKDDEDTTSSSAASGTGFWFMEENLSIASSFTISKQVHGEENSHEKV
jgi:hypothetical protein